METVFNELSTVAILAIYKLDNVASRVPNSSIILNHDILKSLDKFPLDIASLTCFDCCVNNTFSTPHCMEKVFWRGQAC